ncbi:MAG: inositol monophosphatase family protein [Rhodospirillaceae bacterium]
MKIIAAQLADVAHAAGAAILELRGQALGAWLKEPGQLVTLADRRSHEIIQRELGRRFPGVTQILEEQDNPEVLPACYLTADELDGTAIYASGFPEWGVTLALIEDGQPVAGVLHQPVLGTTVTAWRGGGTWVDGSRVRLSPRAALASSIAMLELNRFLNPDHVAWVGRVAHQALAGITQATAVGNTIALLRGQAAVYLNCRGAKVWDFAAAALAVAEAGGVVLAADGGGIDWLRLPVGALLAANPSVAAEVLALRDGLPGPA